MPSAQVLQAFGERIAFHIALSPPALRAFCKTYSTEWKPPNAISALYYQVLLEQLP